MWLGMLAAAAAQIPGFPLEPLNALDAPPLAYIAQVAAWCGRPSWAYLHLRIGIGGLVASYLRNRRSLAWGAAPVPSPPPRRRPQAEKGRRG